MKIIDQKGKLFGIINVVDLLVLLSILAALIAVGVTLFAAPIKEATSPNVEMTTILRIRGAMPQLVEEIERNPLVDKNLVSGTSFLDATITSVSIEDYVVQAITDDGTIVDAVDPSKKDIIVTISSEIAEGTPTPKIGNQEVRAGRTYILKTQDFEVNANIDSVIIHDGDN